MIWGVFVLNWIVGLGCGVCIGELGKKKIWPLEDLLSAVHLIKLFQFPVYGLSIFFSIFFIIFILMPVLFFLLCVLTIVLSGVAGRAAVACCQAEGMITEEEARRLKKRMFYFFLDVAAADKLHEKAKRDEASNENGN